MENIKNDLSRQELMDGKFSGIHNVTVPIIGYKKIECICNDNPWWKFLGDNFKCTRGIATLEIPIGSKIVRPLYLKHRDFEVEHYAPAEKLRTDTVIFKNYEPLNNIICKQSIINDIWRRYYIMINNCYCYSIMYQNYEYKQNEKHESQRALNLDITENCGSGIHFFIEKENAIKYLEI